MAWDEEEIPVEVLKARVQRLQTAMAESGEDAIILYTNFIRSAAVSYLTAFSPYWADGVLLVPREGEPVFATTLSKRVGTWIQSVKPVGDLVNSPIPGAALGKRLAASAARRVAILELDAFPAGLYDDLAAALPGVDIVDGSELFTKARAQTDPVERRLLERADAIAKDALEGLTLNTTINIGSAVGAVEKHARLKGAEEVYVAVAPDLDSDRRFLRLSGERNLGRRFAIRATVAYKGAWVRHTKTYSQAERDSLPLRRSDSWFKALAASLHGTRALEAQITEATRSLNGAQLTRWLAESPGGTRPLAVVASYEKAAPSSAHRPALILTVELTVDEVPWCGAGLTGAGSSTSA
jgi:hypothetical protein